jgi:hypothetical protein
MANASFASDDRGFDRPIFITIDFSLLIYILKKNLIHFILLFLHLHYAFYTVKTGVSFQHVLRHKNSASACVIYMCHFHT